MVHLSRRLIAMRCRGAAPRIALYFLEAASSTSMPAAGPCGAHFARGPD
jgi:hypothetical protein